MKIINLKKEKKRNPAAIGKLRFEALAEGICAQTLHRGPFSEEGSTIGKVHEFIRARGKLGGKHHEIYLSDIRKADPTKWKTVIRQPLAVTGVQTRRIAKGAPHG